MPVKDFSNPGTKFVEVDEMLERKRDNERKNLGSGIMASWNSPVEALDPKLVPEDRRKLILETQAKMADRPADPVVFSPAARPALPSRAVTVPAQAIKKLKILLDTLPEVSVILKPEEAQVFLNSLESMKPPKNMADVKALVRLTDALEKIINGQ